MTSKFSLTEHFFEQQVPVKIDLVGGLDTDCPTLQITNFASGIRVFWKVILGNVWDSDVDLCVRLLATIDRSLKELVDSGKLSPA